jgi:hypothetical protein
MSRKGFLGKNKRAVNAQSADRMRKTKKRFKRPKPPAPPKATSVSEKRYEEDDQFSCENKEVQSMLDLLKKNDPSFLK